MSRTTLALAGLTALASLSVASAHNLLWYDAALGSLPDGQCWEYVLENGNVEPVLEEGAAHLGPTLLTGRAYWRREVKPFVAADGASVTVATTIINSSYLQSGSLRRAGFTLMMTDSLGRWARLGVSNSRLILQTTPNSWGDKVLGYVVDENPHQYRIEFFNGQVTARVDGVAVLTASAGTGGVDKNTVVVGDSTMWAHSESYTSYMLVETAPLCGAGDFNCDGRIDAIDLSELLAHWGEADCANDLDFDGVLGTGDISILLGGWSI